jgi:hypothetical protein
MHADSTQINADIYLNINVSLIKRINHELKTRMSHELDELNANGIIREKLVKIRDKFVY